ncbi:methyltransferase [Sulfolobus acidocaldarius SUSAZ]|nr:methyltransferase [Sulfolobus acidocaldarius SUSAZ]
MDDSIFTDPIGYKNWYVKHNDLYESERKLVQSFKLKNCIDLGSGPGTFHEVINGRKISIDISLLMLNEVDKSEDRILADVSNIPLRDNATECVFISLTICFVDNVRKFINEAMRVTKERLVACFIPSDSELGKYYEELGKRGHRYYSKARFISKKELYALLSNYNIVSVRSTLLNEKEKTHEIRYDDSGSYVCVEVSKQSS